MTDKVRGPLSERARYSFSQDISNHGLTDYSKQQSAIIIELDDALREALKERDEAARHLEAMDKAWGKDQDRLSASQERERIAVEALALVRVTEAVTVSPPWIWKHQIIADEALDKLRTKLPNTTTLENKK